MPKSNKIKRKEKEEKALLRKEREAKQQKSLAARKELEDKRIQYAMSVLSASKIRNPRETIKAIYKGEKVKLPSSSHFNTYRSMFVDMEQRKKDILYSILVHCEEEGVHFVDTGRTKNFSNAVCGLVHCFNSWLRPIEEWKPNSYNAKKQFSSLLRHLLAKYSIPLFMDSAFYSGNKIYQDWFIHVGKGNNIRTAQYLPIPFTKKLAHHMMLAPGDFDINAAVRWGQIHAMGGNERLVDAILKTRIGNVFTNNDFWESVFRWFMDNPMLDTAQYAPIVDYIYHQKFVSSVYNDTQTELVPPQPNLSMKKRSVESTIKAMELWHKQVGRARKGGEKYWNSSGIPEFHHEEGEHNKKIYTISELLSTKELQEEGNAMSHCVGSYSYSCVSGRTSVWSMKQLNPDGTLSRLLTIEVDNQSRSIQQARGKHNDEPSFKAMDILNRWSAVTGLSISRWLT